METNPGESTARRVEFFIPWKRMNHHPQTGKPASHSATPELLQLLTSPIAPPFQEAAEFSAQPENSAATACIAHKSRRICERCRLRPQSANFPDQGTNPINRYPSPPLTIFL